MVQENIGEYQLHTNSSLPRGLKADFEYGLSHFQVRHGTELY